VEKVRGMTAQQRTPYYREWAKKRAEAERVEGVVILATRTPTFLIVERTPQVSSLFDEAALTRVAVGRGEGGDRQAGGAEAVSVRRRRTRRTSAAPAP
jgi:hypothetical protein